MRIARVDDVASETLQTFEFDLAIYASGYESRCSSLFSSVKRPSSLAQVVLGFSDVPDERARRINDQAFLREGGAILKVSVDAEKDIFEILDAKVPKRSKIRVFVDYSSMSRIWINSIINYFKLSTKFDFVEIIFNYTVGVHVSIESRPRYPKSDYQVSTIETLSALEGLSVRQRKTLALLGLGFEWVSPFAACELVEPHDVEVFFAEPGVTPDYGRAALSFNEAFLRERSIDVPIACPLRSVEAVYRNLGEIVAPALASRNVIIIPLGPKPHVLASILLANRLPEITCLYVNGRHDSIHQVTAAAVNDLVVTNVKMVADNLLKKPFDEEID